MNNHNVPDLILDSNEIELIYAARVGLAEFLKSTGAVNIAMSLQNTRQHEADFEFNLPVKAIHLIAELLGAMAQGQPVTILQQSTDVSTHDAAQLLNVSRPTLNQLLTDQKIPYQRLGRHRRIRLEDILKFKTNNRPGF